MQSKLLSPTNVVSCVYNSVVCGYNIIPVIEPSEIAATATLRPPERSSGAPMESDVELPRV